MDHGHSRLPLSMGFSGKMLERAVMPSSGILLAQGSELVSAMLPVLQVRVFDH